VAPVETFKALLWNMVYAPSISFCLGEAVSRETEANNIQNHATHRLLREPSEGSLESFIESCNTQIAETRVARDVAYRMLYSRRTA
jgi:hypothetical protein